MLLLYKISLAWLGETIVNSYNFIKQALNKTLWYIYSHADSGTHSLDDSVSSFSAPLSDSSERLLQALGGSPAITQLLGSPSTRTATLVCNNMLSILSSLKVLILPNHTELITLCRHSIRWGVSHSDSLSWVSWICSKVFCISILRVLVVVVHQYLSAHWVM